MGVLEIVLLLAGGVLAVLSFVIPVAREEVPKETKELAQGEIKSLIGQEMDSIRHHVDDVVDEAVGYAVEKTERSLERLTNEKIMAVNEYSDTVLQEIHKNHEEAMFLYDMLNSKHKNLKETVTEVNKTVKEVEETKREAEAVVNSFQQMKPESMAESFKPLAPEIAQVRGTTQTREIVQAQEFASTQGLVSAQGFVPAQETELAREIAQARETIQAQGLASAEAALVKEVKTGLTRLAMAQKGDKLQTTEKESSAESMAVKPLAAPNSTENPLMAQSISEPAPKPSIDLNFMDMGQEPAETRNEQILKMHQQGKSKVAIAKELGLGVGEVKLVIDLYKNL
ncbi:MAG: DUF6115 domain-containing protein [Butyrivibrio sp.]|nr:DUF6115 domain-containing protein [Muribaculum sp.]MCM1553154.1 DUF6115 domain-containing protein [Butyrivibrio sp.]